MAGRRLDDVEVLTSEERAIVSDPADLRIIAALKHVEVEQGIEGLREFQRFKIKPEAQRIYNHIQAEWWVKSAYFLEEKLKRKPTEIEKKEAYLAREDLRYRAFFAMKFPDKGEWARAPRSTQLQMAG